MATKWVDELSINEEAQARWRQDPALRAEFGSFACYVAYARASAAGLVKISATNRVLGGAQRPIHREDRQELSKWVRQALQTIRKDSPVTGTKPQTIRTLDGPRRLSDGDLLGMIRSEKEAAEYRDMSPALQEEFPSSAILWNFARAKRGGRIKTLR